MFKNYHHSFQSIQINLFKSYYISTALNINQFSRQKKMDGQQNRAKLSIRLNQKTAGRKEKCSFVPVHKSIKHKIQKKVKSKKSVWSTKQNFIYCRVLLSFLKNNLDVDRQFCNSVADALPKKSAFQAYVHHRNNLTKFGNIQEILINGFNSNVKAKEHIEKWRSLGIPRKKDQNFHSDPCQTKLQSTLKLIKNEENEMNSDENYFLLLSSQIGFIDQLLSHRSPEQFYCGQVLEGVYDFPQGYECDWDQNVENNEYKQQDLTQQSEYIERNSSIMNNYTMEEQGQLHCNSDKLMIFN